MLSCDLVWPPVDVPLCAAVTMGQHAWIQRCSTLPDPGAIQPTGTWALLGHTPLKMEGPTTLFPLSLKQRKARDRNRHNASPQSQPVLLAFVHSCAILIFSKHLDNIKGVIQNQT